MLKLSIDWLKLSLNRYLFLIFAFLIGLLFSKFLLSVTLFFLVGNWIFEGELKKKILVLFRNKAAIFFLLIFALHIVGLIYTSDFNYALKDLRVKLPLLVLPIVFGSIEPFPQKYIKQIIRFFVLLVLVSSIFSIVTYYQAPHLAHRNTSPFIHHIRFSLLVTIAFFFVIYEALCKKSKSFSIQLLYWLIASYLFLFILLFLGSINGIVIFAFTLFWWIGYFIFKNKSITFKIISVIGILSISYLLIIWLFQFKNNYFPPQKSLSFPLEEYTAQGTPYFHGLEANVYENGNPIHIYVCEEELEKEWSKRDNNISFNELFNEKHQIKDVLIRYMTSKGLKKDSVGFSQLNEKDIHYIINGVTHYKLAGKKPIISRLYELYWGYYNKNSKGLANDNSLLLRLQYWKVSVMIIQQYPIFGVGTGDIKHAFKEQYDKINTTLEPNKQRRSHNQYLSISVTFGLFGLFVFIFALTYPAIINKRFNSFHFTTVFIILLLSMITEDTIETQVGVSIFSFFYCFFLENNPSIEN